MKKFLLVLFLGAATPGAAAASGGALGELNAVSPYGADDIPAAVQPQADPGAGSFIKGSPPASVSPGLEKSFEPSSRYGGGSSATKYDTLKELFESGRPARDSELSSWYSGRYVGRGNPDTFYGSLMVGFPTSVDGPLYPSKFWVALPRQNADPAYYDSLTPAKIAAIRASLNQYKVRITFPQAAGTYIYTDGTSFVVYNIEYRRSGDYIIEKMGDTEPGAGYTYYFINVTPKK